MIYLGHSKLSCIGWHSRVSIRAVIRADVSTERLSNKLTPI